MKSIILLTCLLSAPAERYGLEALKDEIHDLPGAPAKIPSEEYPWRQFSGYIDVSPEGKNNTRKLFYWYVEAQKDAESAPLFLWTNGGPGCSGLAGFMTENGPFRPGFDGKSLVWNPYSWNKIVNMIFIEQPAGVGFSQAAEHIDYADAQAAEDNYKFIMGFYKKFPNLKDHDFYLSSESYGGHYIPTLASLLVKKGGAPKFKGCFVGNPLTYMPYRDHGFYGTLWGHQLLPKYLWDDYNTHNCQHSESTICYMITSKMNSAISGLDPYALDFPTCRGAEATGQKERLAILNVLARATNSPVQTYQPCTEDMSGEYLNLKEVKEAIHAEDVEWDMCSNQVNYYYNTTDTHAPMMPYWIDLIKSDYNLNLMIYSGDDDAICATLGSQQFVWDLGFEPKDDRNWISWKVDEQMAGYWTDFEVPSQGSFSFVTVHNAGHMVPSTQPKRSLVLLSLFLKHQWHGNVSLGSFES